MPMPMPMPIGYDMSNMRQQDSQPIVIKHYIDKNNIKQNTSQAPYVLVQQIFKCDGDNTPEEEPVYNNTTTPRRTTTTPRRTTTTPRRTTTTPRRTTTTRRRTTTPTTTTTTTPTTTTPTTTTTPNVEELDALALDALTRFSRTDNNLEQWIQNVKILVNTTRTLVNRYKDARNYEHAGIVIQNALSQITQNNPELFNAGLVRIEPQMNELSEMALDIMQKIDQA
jgi:hypothetical protein